MKHDSVEMHSGVWVVVAALWRLFRLEGVDGFDGGAASCWQQIGRRGRSAPECPECFSSGCFRGGAFLACA